MPEKPYKIFALNPGSTSTKLAMFLNEEPVFAAKAVHTAEELAKKLTDKIFEDCDYAGSEVALMVNGLGGTPLMELYILNNEVEKILTERGITIHNAVFGGGNVSSNSDQTYANATTVFGNTTATLYLPVAASSYDSATGVRYVGKTQHNGVECAHYELTSGTFSFELQGSKVVVK